MNKHEEAKQFLLTYVNESEMPVTPSELLEAGRNSSPRINYSEMRSALWHLADAGQIDFTSDRRIKATGHTN